MRLIKKYKILLKLGNKLPKLDQGGRLGVYQDRKRFANDLFNTAYSAFLADGQSKEVARRLALYTVGHKALESDYGLKLAGDFNYGGIGGVGNFNSYKSMKHYMSEYIRILHSKYPNVFKAKTYQDYSNALFESTYGYCPYDVKGNQVHRKLKNKYHQGKSRQIYWSKIGGTKTRVSGYLGVRESDWDYSPEKIITKRSYPIFKNDNTQNVKPNVTFKVNPRR